MEKSSALQRRHKREINVAELPESCISAILSFTSLRDICRLSVVSKHFRSAAYDDFLWNKFLPQQCYQILRRAVIPVTFCSKRELYFRLCETIIIDKWTKIFWLEAATANMGYMISPRELTITWGSDQRFWHWGSQYDSRFEQVAELLMVCWLEVRGRVDCRLLSANTEYRVVFVLKLGEHPYGWSEVPITFWVTAPTGEPMELKQLLMETQGGRRSIYGRWIEVVAGEFTTRFSVDNHNSHFEFCMQELDGGHWKGGLLIYGVKIEPKFT